MSQNTRQIYSTASWMTKESFFISQNGLYQSEAISGSFWMQQDRAVSHAVTPIELGPNGGWPDRKEGWSDIAKGRAASEWAGITNAIRSLHQWCDTKRYLSSFLSGDAFSPAPLPWCSCCRREQVGRSLFLPMKCSNENFQDSATLLHC